jgi:hypothetical protein
MKLHPLNKEMKSCEAKWEQAPFVASFKSQNMQVGKMALVSKS